VVKVVIKNCGRRLRLFLLLWEAVEKVAGFSEYFSSLRKNKRTKESSFHTFGRLDLMKSGKISVISRNPFTGVLMRLNHLNEIRSSLMQFTL